MRASVLGLVAVAPLWFSSPQLPSWDPLRAVDGSLLFACGTGFATAELYFKDDAGVVHQLTVTQPKAGVNSATWRGEQIVAVIDRDFSNRMELRELDTPPDAVGEPLGRGFAPAVSSTGTVAYVRVGENRTGRLVDEVVRLKGRRRDVLAQRHLIWDLFWVGRRVVAFSESRAGRASLVEVSRRPARAVRLPGTDVGMVAISPRRRVAYSFGGRRDRRFAIMRLDGTHRRVFRGSWVPRAWSPDGGRLLVAQSSEVGLMNPDTGEVQSLGRLPCEYVGSAEWAPPGAHTWPAP